MYAPRTRPRRPILNAIKNPCSCATPNPPVMPRIPQIQLQPGALQPMQVQFPLAAPAQAPAASPQSPGNVQQTQPQFQTPAAQNQQWWNVAANTAVGNLGNAWLPATSGPQPPGAAVWVEWTGGSTGIRRISGSTYTQQVTVLQTMQGGPSGVMVLVRATPQFAAAM